MQLLLWLILSAQLLACAAGGLPAGEVLHITTADGPRNIRVELVDRPETRAVGLMHRTELPQGQGMLFDFNRSAPVRMWMKNTLIPLDMLFISQQGVVVQVSAHRQPGDETRVYSPGPVRAVLELPAGAADTLGIRVGDQLHHTLFETQ